MAIIAIATLVVMYIPTNTTVYTQTQPEVILAQPDPIEPPLLEVPELYPALKRICSCESNGNPNGEPRQFNVDGSVLRGRINPADVGMCQINLKYHEAQAKSMNLDLFTAYGNATYANWLYEQDGDKPWNWSKKCWN